MFELSVIASPPYLIIKYRNTIFKIKIRIVKAVKAFLYEKYPDIYVNWIKMTINNSVNNNK